MCGCGTKTEPIGTKNQGRGYKRGDYRRFIVGHHVKLKRFIPGRLLEIGSVHGRLTVLEFLGSGTEVGKKNSNYYYRCVCACGKEKVMSQGNLNRGRTKSCGCFAVERMIESRRKPYGYSSSLGFFNRYKVQARKRKIHFGLSFDEFSNITSRNCIYCGDKPTPHKEKPSFNGECMKNGVDRVDSSIGYVKENCVPCCARCNHAKFVGNVDDFIAWTRRLAKHVMEVYPWRDTHFSGSSVTEMVQ